MISKNNGENIWNCPKNVVSLHRKWIEGYACWWLKAVIVNGIWKSCWKIFYSRWRSIFIFCYLFDTCWGSCENDKEHIDHNEQKGKGKGSGETQHPWMAQKKYQLAFLFNNEGIWCIISNKKYKHHLISLEKCTFAFVCEVSWFWLTPLSFYSWSKLTRLNLFLIVVDHSLLFRSGVDWGA